MQVFQAVSIRESDAIFHVLHLTTWDAEAAEKDWEDTFELDTWRLNQGV